MNIGIDIDDTISMTFENATEYAKEYIKNTLGKEPIIEMSNVKDHYYIRDMFGLTDEEADKFWDDYYVRIIENVKPKPFSVEVINKLKEDGNRIVIITARWSKNGVSAFDISKKWLDKQGIQYDKLYTDIEVKDEIALDEKIDLFIDDSISQCNVVTNAGIKSYLFDSNTNKHINPDKKIERVLSWDEIYNKVKVM